MTPERWGRIDDLFDAALRLGPVEREAWLHAASGSEAQLRAEVGSLLAHDNRAQAEGFLTPPVAPQGSSDRTGTWFSHDHHRPSARHQSLDQVETGFAAGDEGFVPKAAIAPGTQPHPISESESVVRARLRELPMIYILFLGMATFYRIVILGYYDLVIYYFDLTITLSFAAAIALLSSRWPISLSRLKALELVMIGLFATRNAIVEYRLVLIFSQSGNPVMAHLTVKNLVLLTCILILTYGLYVPKTWRRAALVAGTLTVLPFAPLVGLYALYPTPMHWLAEGITL